MAIRSWGSRRIKRYAQGDQSRYDAALHAKIDSLLARLDDGASRRSSPSMAGGYTG